MYIESNNQEAYSERTDDDDDDDDDDKDGRTTHFESFYLSKNKPIGASPGRDYEDGISTKNLVLNILWCRIVGKYRKRGGTLRGRATD